MRVNYKPRHSINYSIYGYAKLYFSFFYVYSLSFLYPDRRSEKDGKYLAKHAINFPAHYAECHYCDVC